MRCKRIKKSNKNLIFILCYAAGSGYIIKQGHHGGDCSICLKIIGVLADFLYAAVEVALQLRADSLALHDVLKRPYPVKKALAALDGVCVPWRRFFKVADEHFIKAKGICAVLFDNIVRVDHVAAALGHFFVVLAQNHAVACALLIRLFCGNNADVIEEFVPETAVKHVKGGVLHTAVVPVNGHPVVKRLF